MTFDCAVREESTFTGRCAIINDDDVDGNVDEQVHDDACEKRGRADERRAHRRDRRDTRLLFVSSKGNVMREKKKEICELRTGKIVSAAAHKLSY